MVIYIGRILDCFHHFWRLRGKRFGIISILLLFGRFGYSTWFQWICWLLVFANESFWISNVETLFFFKALRRTKSVKFVFYFHWFSLINVFIIVIIFISILDELNKTKNTKRNIKDDEKEIISTVIERIRLFLQLRNFVGYIW